ncbi:FAD-dependent oxidoreductase [uncultured Sneathiella sp.]|jgi:predicted NAD/FAD-binding protein|uniref:NAD(P)/FAD-dependent oxidoreductase n=1 Tax=uncultured Sneathiella sp. TaxID=879315 RepID=UPI0030D9E8D0|tara:strand:+ start:1457 stop:2788 length:1332 start_codon:yes stop_codon:yes gene_type:complete
MKKIAVIGSGISGLSAAWLLSRTHDVTLYEKDDRLGGHSNTVEVDGHQVDTGFIVYNQLNYPNLVAFLDHLGVASKPTEMSFSVSLNKGAVEYAGTSLGAMFAQKSNLLRPAHWGMIRDILKFYRAAPALLQDAEKEHWTLGDVLAAGQYGQAFTDHHLLPMGAAIWSTPAADMLDYPAAAFIRFCSNHGLLQLSDRPEWRTIKGGSREYVTRVADILKDRVYLNSAVAAVHTDKTEVIVECRDGRMQRFDDVVLATHADQALHMIAEPSPAQRKLLGAFSYEKNLAVLHRDAALMPKRRKAWASWNYIGNTGSQDEMEDSLCVSYWMNRLQGLDAEQDYFVTLNPAVEPRSGTVLRSFPYEHPLFDTAAMAAQKLLWNLQGQKNLWFCGSYFGYGFHEDGIQSGLAVAEALGGTRRPWRHDPAASRIHLPETGTGAALADVA